MKKKLSLNEEQFYAILMGMYDNAILEYRRYTYDPWVDIENNRMPKTYTAKEQYGDKLRNMCRLITRFVGMRTTYDGIEEVNDDYFDTPENRANYKSTGRTANRFHVITIHFPLAISSYGEDSDRESKLNKLECIKYMLKRFKFRKLSEERRGDEIAKHYGISEYQTRHEKDFISRMESNNYEGYIKMFALSCNLKDGDEDNE